MTFESQTSSLDRREWLKLMSLLAASVVAGHGRAHALVPKRQAGPPYRVGRVTSGAGGALNDGKHIPFGWSHATLAPDRPVSVAWSGGDDLRRCDVLLRVTGATDIRENVTAEARLAMSKQMLGRIDMRYGHLMQPFELKIAAGRMPAVLAEGVELTLVEGSGPVWIFGHPRDTGLPDAYAPHLIADEGDGADAWEQRLLSLDSVQRFGWMEGSAMDGLHALALAKHGPEVAARLARGHWELFLDEERKLRFVGIHNGLYDISRVGGEDPLPFATLAKVWPDSPAMEQAISYFEGIANPARPVSRWLSTEGAYTMCYPMAAVAQAAGRPHLARTCVAGLRARRDFLVEGGSIYRSGNRQEGTKGFANWARGATWYVLGFERSLEHLPSDQPGRGELIEAFGAAMEICFRHQRDDGLWTCFMDEPETGVDTSGSAGLAAAAALGVKNGFLDARYGPLARKTFETLTSKWLAPDGYLRGAAQENKGGRELQVEGFRGISPYTLGLLGLLKAGLE